MSFRKICLYISMFGHLLSTQICSLHWNSSSIQTVTFSIVYYALVSYTTILATNVMSREKNESFKSGVKALTIATRIWENIADWWKSIVTIKILRTMFSILQCVMSSFVVVEIDEYSFYNAYKKKIASDIRLLRVLYEFVSSFPLPF